jgi:hypothetical protein
MYSLQAKIGDVVEVTLIESDSGLQTEERINDKSAFLHSKSAGARASDRCKVKIVGQNAGRTVYFVSLVAVVQLGDGKCSILQHACNVINGLNSQSSNLIVSLTPGVRLLESACGDDKLRLLNLLVKLSCSYYYDLDQDSKPVDIEFDASSLISLAKEIMRALPDTAVAAVRDACIALGDSCFDRYEFEHAEGFFLNAHCHCIPGTPEYEQTRLDLSAATYCIRKKLEEDCAARSNLTLAIEGLGIEISLCSDAWPVT